MRDILFKAKRIDNGEWVEGYYVYHIKRTICAFNDKVKAEDEQHVIMQDGFSDWNMPRDTVHYDINPDTLCQYTGLTDKNGNKIWENDIVNKIDTNGLGYHRERKCKVSFDELGYWLLTTEYGDGYWLGEFDSEQLEVIGNIFDNLELLERGVE